MALCIFMKCYEIVKKERKHILIDVVKLTNEDRAIAIESERVDSNIVAVWQISKYSRYSKLPSVFPCRNVSFRKKLLKGLLAKNTE